MSSKVDFAALLELERDEYKRLRYLGEAAYLWLYRGELDRAETIFTGLTDLVPRDPVGHAGLAEVHLTRREYAKAARAARRALVADGADLESMSMAYALLGASLLEQGRHDEAMAALRDAEEVAPSSHGAESARALREAHCNTKAPPSDNGHEEYLQ